MPRPAAVLGRVAAELVRPDTWRAIQITLGRALIGYAIAIGGAIGLAMTRLRWLRAAFGGLMMIGDRPSIGMRLSQARELADAEGLLAWMEGAAGSVAGTAGGFLLIEGGDELVERANVLQLLLDPIAVALANDRRLHEMARPREAAEAENRLLLSRLQRSDISDSIVGAEAGLKEVMTRVDQVSRTDAPVLILGETGSGKEVVARSIHTKSRRSGGPFLRVNCGAIPSELVDSELFGHERGSFTCALAQRKGWFERADGGTLFLDEVGELPAAAQVRLLRVLQDGTFERVGGQHALNVDVRIVAATHRDMQRLIADGRFREDLWFRISVFPIRLPALRERRQDVAPLARHFAERAGLRLHGVPLVPGDSESRVLSPTRGPATCASWRRSSSARRSSATGPAASSASPAASLDADPATLDASIIRHIEEALAATRGQIEGRSGAAARLGINPHTLRSRMRRLGIDWRRFRPGPSAEPVAR